MLDSLQPVFKLRPLAILVLLPAAAGAASLSNGKIAAEFGERGLTLLRDLASGAVYRFAEESFAITIDGATYVSRDLGNAKIETGAGVVTYSYRSGDSFISVAYELRPAWRFLSKRISISSSAGRRFRVDAVTVFRSILADQVQNSYTITRPRPNRGTEDYGGCLRLENHWGLLVTAQNPFLRFEREGNAFLLRYQPEMDWDPRAGQFEADRGLLVPYQQSGNILPAQMLREWKMAPADSTPGMDEAEIAAFTDLVRAFLLYQPKHPSTLVVGWCANDYQIDIATPEGRAEYQRILDMAAQLGAQEVLFAPSNSTVSRRRWSTDDWRWENVLWLGMGEKIRRNEWDPSSGPIPESVQEMLNYARSKHLQLLAYVYPVLGFIQNPEWLVGPGKTRATLGVPSFQDWLIRTLELFARHTGIAGYSFDHTFLNLPGRSRYAQWWGWRRVLETLRRDFPDLVIDGRQAYQDYGPWSWLAGNYPHPTSTDEQPESFVSFPDLKLDRVSADRERYTAYWYRNYEFAPSEIVPGFITHQTPRNEDSGKMPIAATAQDDVPLPFRRRDWDYLGWRYSLLSSIAVAGWNNVINMIPARDPDEFRSFSQDDRKWFRHWIEWTDTHREYLRRTRTILGQPALGKADGAAAILQDRGYVFLFNPNGRPVAATFTLDDHIGLTRKGKYLIRELYPLENRLVGKPGNGAWSWGDSVTRALDGASAVVLEIEPDPRAGRPRLFNSPGEVRVHGRVAHLLGVRGEVGTQETLFLEGANVDAVEIGGVRLPVRTVRNGLVEARVTFAGPPFHHQQQIAPNGKFQIPRRIFEQLAARRKAWPISWTPEDERSTWLDPGRLLLYVQFAEPDDRWDLSLRIDGKPVKLEKAYASVRANRRNFTGFYADISHLTPDVDHRLDLSLPEGLKAGQFLGVFVENVETEWTGNVLRLSN
jgi:hypothetical protein